MKKTQPTKKAMANMQLGQNWDNFHDTVKDFLIAIPDYIAKYPGNNYTTHDGNTMILWEFYFLTNHNIISTKGIKNPRLYKAFCEAQAQYYDNIDKLK